jgi:hypothetical protein
MKNSYRWIAVAIIIFVILGTMFLRRPNPNPQVQFLTHQRDSLTKVTDSLNYEILELSDQNSHLMEEISMLKAEKGIY